MFYVESRHSSCVGKYKLSNDGVFNIISTSAMFNRLTLKDIMNRSLSMSARRNWHLPEKLLQKTIDFSRFCIIFPGNFGSVSHCHLLFVTLHNSRKACLQKVAQKGAAGGRGSLQLICPCFPCRHLGLSCSFPSTSQCDVSVPKILNRLEIVWLPNSVGVKAHISEVKGRDFQFIL